eukprot:g11173.t1
MTVAPGPFDEQRCPCLSLRTVLREILVNDTGRNKCRRGKVREFSWAGDHYHPFGSLRKATKFAKENNVTIHVVTESDELSRDIIARAQLAIATRKREAAAREAAARRKAKAARRQQVVRAAKVAAAAAAAAASAAVEAALSMAAESDA